MSSSITDVAGWWFATGCFVLFTSFTLGATLLYRCGAIQ